VWERSQTLDIISNYKIIMPGCCARELVVYATSADAHRKFE